MDISRKAFLTCTLALGAGSILGLGACGGDDEDPGGGAGTGGGGGGSCQATGSDITDNHQHALTVPAADLDSTTEKTYSIQGGSPHEHTVTLTPAHLATLKGGNNVSVTSTSASGHSHEVTVRCA